jgi:hypothetical protein
VAEFAGEGGASAVVKIRSKARTCRGTQASVDAELAVLADEAGGRCRDQWRGVIPIRFDIDSGRRSLMWCPGEPGVLEEIDGVDRREDVVGWIAVPLGGGYR